MEIAGTFLREVITLAGYALMFAAVYKLFQIGTELSEIKDLLKRGQYSGPSTSAESAAGFMGGEDAYAERLLKSLHNTPGGTSEAPEPSEVR